MNKTTRGFLGIYIVLIIILVLLFIKYVIIADHKRLEALIPITYKTRVTPSLVENLQDRGGIIFNDSLVINSGLPVFEKPKGFNGWRTGRIGSPPPVYRLANIPPPYILWKAANNDTVYVQKNDTLNFKFLLDE